MSVREVGGLDVVDQFLAQAEGIIRREDFEAFMAKGGWKPDGVFQFRNRDSEVLYTSSRYVFAKLTSHKKFVLTHADGSGFAFGAGR